MVAGPPCYVDAVNEYRGSPIEVAGAAPGAVGNYVFVPLALIMLVLSLRKREA